ncbi:MAG: DUF4386 domain-containing protein [Flavobacteriaceae bacterium]|nr:DUF4386 domain-containing protein [Flavobacteriaceae bacterium]
MNNSKRFGRTVGLLMLGVIVFGIPSTLFRGINTTMTEAPDFMETVFNQRQAMRYIMPFDVLASALWLVIGGIMLPWMKRYSNTLAAIFLGLLIVFLTLIVIGNMSHLTLIDLATRFTESGSTSETFRILGFAKVKDYLWSHIFSLILYASANFLLLFFLFKSQMVPRILTVWGMMAMVIVFSASWLQLLGFSVSIYAYAQNGIHFITFITWLLIKGFRTPDPIRIGM